MFSRERRWEVGERGTGVGREGGRRWERVPPVHSLSNYKQKFQTTSFNSDFSLTCKQSAF
jgi:hypothetical protein